MNLINAKKIAIFTPPVLFLLFMILTNFVSESPPPTAVTAIMFIMITILGFLVGGFIWVIGQSMYCYRYVGKTLLTIDNLKDIWAYACKPGVTKELTEQRLNDLTDKVYKDLKIYKTIANKDQITYFVKMALLLRYIRLWDENLKSIPNPLKGEVMANINGIKVIKYFNIK